MAFLAQGDLGCRVGLSFKEYCAGSNESITHLKAWPSSMLIRMSEARMPEARQSKMHQDDRVAIQSMATLQLAR